MISLHYKVYPAEDIDDHINDPSCVTTKPRYSLDGSQAILKFTSPVDGWITHEEAFELVQTPEWQEEP